MTFDVANNSNYGNNENACKYNSKWRGCFCVENIPYPMLQIPEVRIKRASKVQVAYGKTTNQ